MQAPVADHTNETLVVAAKVFQAQLAVFSKQPLQHRHAGFKQLARKQRLEFRAGDSALGQLGLLQGIATTVRENHAISRMSITEPVHPVVSADSELRWCKPSMT